MGMATFATDSRKGNIISSRSGMTREKKEMPDMEKIPRRKFGRELSRSHPAPAQHSLSTLGLTQNITCSEAISNHFTQTAADASIGYTGQLIPSNGFKPFVDPFYKSDMCAVNVHWRLGAEHYSEGECEEIFADIGPECDIKECKHRRL